MPPTLRVRLSSVRGCGNSEARSLGSLGLKSRHIRPRRTAREVVAIRQPCPKEDVIEKSSGHEGGSLRVTRRGFTLLEALIALGILTLSVSVLLSVHMQTLRAERIVQWMDRTRLRMETVGSCVMLGDPARAVETTVGGEGWLVRSEVRPSEAGNRWVTFWTVAPSNVPEAGMTLCLRPVEIR